MNILRFIKPLIQKIPGAADYYRYLRDSKPLRTEVAFREKLGFFFNGDLSMEKGQFEPQETAIFESLLGKFDIFINVGANTGYYVCKALNRAVPVVAFEPNQLNVNILLKNVAANKFKADFQLFPVALSNQHGILPMYGVNTGASLIDGWAGQKHKYLVPISKFDSIAKSSVENKSCLVLIDIEGGELNCLKGAETLLTSQKNVFLVEITIGEHQPKGININPNLVDTFNFMFTRGYKAFTADASLRKVEMQEVRNVASSEIDTLGTHNFIFTKNEEVINKIVFLESKPSNIKKAAV